MAKQNGGKVSGAGRKQKGKRLNPLLLNLIFLNLAFPGSNLLFKLGNLAFVKLNYLLREIIDDDAGKISAFLLVVVEDQIFAEQPLQQFGEFHSECLCEFWEGFQLYADFSQFPLTTARFEAGEDNLEWILNQMEMFFGSLRA